MQLNQKQPKSKQMAQSGLTGTESKSLHPHPRYAAYSCKSHLQNKFKKSIFLFQFLTAT